MRCFAAARRAATAPVPLPEFIPATLADFLRLVVAGDDAETKFRKFITVQTEMFFTAAQIVFATPEERERAKATWTAA